MLKWLASTGLTSLLSPLHPDGPKTIWEAWESPAKRLRRHGLELDEDSEATWIDRRCMEYHPNAPLNKEWIRKDQALHADESRLRSLELYLENVGDARLENESLRVELQDRVENAKRLTVQTKPNWLRQEEAVRPQRSTRRKATSRGR